MRPVDVKHLRRCNVDLVKSVLHVRRSKNESSHRVIPLNASALNALARMFERADMFDHTKPWALPLDRLSVSNSLSGGDWELDHVPAVGDPTHMVQIGGDHPVSTGEVQGRVARQ